MLCMGKNDQQAIQATLAGDKDAYGTLVVRHSASLLRVALRITGNEADAQDVVQEALLRGYRKLADFDQRSQFGTWIYRIAVRCALDRINSARRDGRQNGKLDGTGLRVSEESDPEQQAVQVADPAAGPDRLLLSGEIGALQQAALSSLTPIERAAFILRHIEDRGSEEIGDALGIAPNAAKQAVYRAVQKMRQRLAALRVSA
jgi:RNA polymerase sigma-70 factor (ECF subfamily)